MQIIEKAHVRHGNSVTRMCKAWHEITDFVLAGYLPDAVMDALIDERSNLQKLLMTVPSTSLEEANLKAAVLHRMIVWNDDIADCLDGPGMLRAIENDRVAVFERESDSDAEAA